MYKLLQAAAAAQKLYTLATMKTVISVKKAKSIQNYPGVDNFFVTETTPMVKERHEKVFRLWEFVKQKKKK